MSFAVIKTGGKQYLILPGQKIKIEKIALPKVRGKKPTVRTQENSEVIFDEVLLLEKDNKLEIGTPLVNGAKVIGKVLRQGKGKKVIIFKHKPKKRYKLKKGHRQPFTEVEILKINYKP